MKRGTMSEQIRNIIPGLSQGIPVQHFKQGMDGRYQELAPGVRGAPV